MKKLFFGMLAIVAMIATSCQQEADLGVKGGEIVSVSFELGTQATRAYSDGTQANHLQWAVYTEGGVLLRDLGGEDDQFNGSKTISLDLATGDTYHLLFWAENADAPYTLHADTKTVTVDYTGVLSNNEKYDAFYAYKTIEVTGATTVSVELKRPFAQLNIGTNDYEKMAKAGRVITKSSVTVPVYSTLNLATGAVDGEQEVTFAYAGVPTGEIPVAGYQYVAMNYLLVSKDQSVVDVEFSYATEDGAYEQTRTVGSVPVQRNYRTNIYGKIFTSATDVEIEINPDFEDNNNVEFKVVSSAQDLQQAIEDLNNSAAGSEGESVNIQLTDDINLNDLLAGLLSRASENGPSLTIASGKTLTLDLNGKTLTANYPTVDAGINLFNVLGTLNVENGTIVMTREDAAFNPSYCTNVFYTGFGGTVNLNGVTATNNSGVGMAYVCDMSNATNATYNVENSTLESSYITVRVFNNNKDGVHNVTIKNSTLKGKYCVWTQFYLADGYTQEELDRQLNLDIYNNENTFTPAEGKLPILYGYNSYLAVDGYGITRDVSEDGTEVTLGYFFDDNNGVVYRGVAGTEQNTTIKKVVVEEGISTLYDRTFRRFYALEEVVLPSTLTTIGAAGSGVFQSCTNLKTVVIPESVTVLGKGTFQECSSLESINIPAGVTRIEADALRATGLVEVEFHEGVTYFGAQAFRDCKQLKKVVIKAPEFTMEGNTFGIMAAPFTPLTIEVANAEMKAYVESKLTAHAKTYITVVAPAVIDNTADLQAALAAGKNVILANDLTISSSEMLTAPYGNKMAVSHNGGVFNGNGKTIGATIGGDNYVVMTNGGTIKDLNINNGFRGVVIMSANQTINLDNVVVGGEGVCYALNTAEGDSTQDLVATNCTFNGWSSWSLLKSAKFTNCTFGQGAYYTNVYGRLGKPYVTTLFDGCEFCSKFYIDLSALGANQVVTLKNCTVNGVKLTAENWASLIAPEDTCGEGQISVELKNGTYLTAENVADYIVIE